jgi:hypothetical protein
MYLCIRDHALLPIFEISVTTLGNLLNPNRYTLIHSYTHTLIHIHTHSYSFTLIFIYTYTHTHTHTLIFIYTYTHIHIHIHSYTHIHSYSYSYTYTHIHIHIGQPAQPQQRAIWGPEGIPHSPFVSQSGHGVSVFRLHWYGGRRT